MSLRRVKHTRGTTQIAAYAAASRSNKRYPLTRADGRTYCAGGSALRLGRDGYLERGLSAHTKCRLSEKPDFLTVFVKAFINFSVLYHRKKRLSILFLKKILVKDSIITPTKHHPCICASSPFPHEYVFPAYFSPKPLLPTYTTADYHDKAAQLHLYVQAL